MKVCYLSIVLTVAMFATSTTFAQQIVSDQDPVSHLNEVSKKKLRLGPHEGTLKNVAGVQVETVVTTAGLRIYLSSADGRPLAVKQSRGIAKLSVQGVAKRYRYDLFPAGDHSLKIDIDLSRFSGRQVSVDCQLVGVSAKTISYSEVSVVPLDEAQVDAIAIARQKVCLVTSQSLGSMGKPFKLVVSGRSLFLCCKGCINKVQANPEKYLAKLDSLGVDAPNIK